MENPDFVAIAKAYGIASRAVEKREELDDAIAEMLNHDGAYVLVANRSEERRVGKECRSRWSPYH